MKIDTGNVRIVASFEGAISLKHDDYYDVTRKIKSAWRIHMDYFDKKAGTFSVSFVANNDADGEKLIEYLEEKTGAKCASRGTFGIRFSDIPTFTKAKYNVSQPISSLKNWLERHDGDEIAGHTLVMDPPYQRGYVWTKQQKINWLEYFLRGGQSGREIYFNCSSWMESFNTPLELVDGKQRINAVLEFLDDKIPVLGYKFSEFHDSLHSSEHCLNINVADLKDPLDVVDWYIGMNNGGTSHTTKDINVALDYRNELLKNSQTITSI
jgi:hypothetical protein